MKATYSLPSQGYLIRNLCCPRSCFYLKTQGVTAVSGVGLSAYEETWRVPAIYALRYIIPLTY
jgi:hypothetical protein